ncbi:hypothetical protein LPTSP3_g30900 [Leptospira kobayashii]|uniref:Uncharacterized protein n=1 Tax=Leptospira kobayashii TaxID=1917830 RepID=A0ABM7UTF5_9LEPT|nr:hypothetical protein [Leptospira kobayashii]BDA80160.1 hypothetical protein LPTSP3_g30900 [Leptospira kobayashii]
MKKQNIRSTKSDEEILYEKLMIENQKIFELTERKNRKNELLSLILRMYSLMGIFLILSGLFYEELIALLKGNPIRLVLIGGGSIILFFSLSYLSIIKKRKIKEKDTF